ncbi:MAG: AAA family ATPase [Bdellovibrionota bacterium]
MPAERLKPEALRFTCDPARFSFKTTGELKDLEDTLGQARASEAIRFGMGIRRTGFNLFVLGPTGSGKHEMARRFLAEKAAAEAVPLDWCYVNNFKNPDEPLALKLPAGRGSKFREDMERFIESLRAAIPSALQSEDYQTRRQAIEERNKERHAASFREIEEQGREKGIALLRAPMGLAFAPVRRGNTITPEEFGKLPRKEQERIQADIEALQEQLRAVLRRALQWEQEEREAIKELNREVTRFAVENLRENLQKRYQDLPEVLAYLDAIQADILENATAFLQPETPQMMGGLPVPAGFLFEPIVRQYEVNLLVDQSGAKGAPVVYEDHPTLQNLVGRVEHKSRFGMLTTDFTLIKAGALHRANGGYLLLDVRRLLQSPLAWEGLKAALRSGRIRIETPAQHLDIVSASTLEPQPIPLDVKIVLLGEAFLYYLLSAYDPDFPELFKVVADFEEDVDRSDESIQLSAQLIATLAKKEGLKPFDAGGVAAVIEHLARLAGDQEKLATHRESLFDVLREADYWAKENQALAVGAAHVRKALDMQIRRMSRLRDRSYEHVLKGIRLLDVSGEKTGQVNGLSVVQAGGFAFGIPNRITARVRMGDGKVLDIEREVKLGGPIHSKGVLILTGFLGGRYAREHPLTLAASLVFEQSYGGVEGDSASLAETCALLSALAEIPVRQDLAVTGSLNQHGEVQAVGGVNEKIEGFFDICKGLGLTGTQGVLLPASNVRHLMLRPDVLEAVKAGKFHVHAVRTVDEALELLTGRAAGERGADNRFSDGSVNRLADDRLLALATAARAWQKTGKEEKEKEKNGP